MQLLTAHRCPGIAAAHRLMRQVLVRLLLQAGASAEALAT
jgi:hypothetical protein